MTEAVEQPIEQPTTPVEQEQVAQPSESLLGGQPVEQGQEGNQSSTTTVDDYSVDIEGFNFADFKAIDENKAFLNEAHKAGLSNEQLGFVLGKYNEIIPNVMEQISTVQQENCQQELQAKWGAETQANLGLAMKAAQAAGLTTDQINDPKFGNNPAVIEVLAHFGKQLSEDTPPNNTQPSHAEGIEQLKMSEAYRNANHPDHKQVAAKVSAWYAKQYPEN